MTVVTPRASRAAAPTQPHAGSSTPSQAPHKPQPDTIPTAHLLPVLAAFNACNLAGLYLERGNIAAARRKLVQALASVNEVGTAAQGGAA
jgi:hypothetical protein